MRVRPRPRCAAEEVAAAASAPPARRPAARAQLGVPRRPAPSGLPTSCAMPAASRPTDASRSER
ncbi:MAG: hypothetical protein MZV64_14610 [Ignavibacteriales bacterium]|nr:hypothetical protein [Ignavibacteriales bacterium]